MTSSLSRPTCIGVVAVGLAIAGCDRHHTLTVTRASDAAPGPAGVPLDQLIAAYLSANCQWLVRCNLWPSPEACATDLLPTYTSVLQNRIAAADAGRVLYDPAAASTCVAAVLAQACTLGAAEPVRAACARVFAGTVPAGGRCLDNDECLGRVCGNQASDACCAAGTCLTTVPAGAACSPGDHCPEGYACAGYQGTKPGTCQLLHAEGEGCATAAECQAALECDRQGSGACVPLLGIGQPCTGQVPSCDSILGYCDRLRGTCQARLPVGAPCDATVADANGGCVHHASCAHGSCVEQPGVGEPCALPDGGDPRAVCRNGRCEDGVCRVPSCPVCE